MKEQKTREQLEAEAKQHFNETLDRLKEQNAERGRFLIEENKRLIQISDYINNALNNPDRAYNDNIPVYRSGVVTNQLLHAYPDIFCQKAVAFALPEYQRIFSLYTLTAKERILSYLPRWCDKILDRIHNLTNSLALFKASAATKTQSGHSEQNPERAQRAKSPRASDFRSEVSAPVPASSAGGKATEPTANSQLSIFNCQLKRHRHDSIVSAIASLSVYNDNYNLLDKEDERAATLELPINRLATMIDYIQFLDPAPDTHTRLFTFLSDLAREAKRMNHRQLRLHNTKK